MGNTPKWGKVLTKDFLEQKYICEKMGTFQISEIVGCSDMTVSTWLKKHGIKTRKAGVIPEDLTGNKFGMLFLVKRLDRESATRRHYIYECLCDCGKTKNISINSIKQGLARSCGCSLKRKGKSHPNWSGTENVSSSYYQSIIFGAKIRKIEFDLTIEYINELLVKQGFRCAVSGLEIKEEKYTTRKNKNPKVENTASLDRIDSSKGYVEGNVQWVHKDINRMKWKHKQDYFIELCNQISQYVKQKRQAKPEQNGT